MRKLAWTAFLAFGAAGVSHAQAPEDHTLWVEWVACVDAADKGPYFSVEVTREGDVRYVGGQVAREKGERHARTTPDKAQKIFGQAHKLVDAQNKGRLAPLQADVDPSLQYCLRIGFDGHPGTRVSAHSRRATTLREPLDELIDTHALACPTLARQLVEKGYCGKRKYEYARNEFDDCGWSHSVIVFADGQGVYQAPEQPKYYFYFTLTPEQLREIDRATANYRTDFMLMPQRVRRPNYSPISRFTDDDGGEIRMMWAQQTVAEFGALLERYAGITWRTPTNRTCTERSELPRERSTFTTPATSALEEIKQLRTRRKLHSLLGWSR